MFIHVLILHTGISSYKNFYKLFNLLKQRMIFLFIEIWHFLQHVYWMWHFWQYLFSLLHLILFCVWAIIQQNKQFKSCKLWGVVFVCSLLRFFKITRVIPLTCWYPFLSFRIVVFHVKLILSLRSTLSSISLEPF